MLSLSLTFAPYIFVLCFLVFNCKSDEDRVGTLSVARACIGDAFSGIAGRGLHLARIGVDLF